MMSKIKKLLPLLFITAASLQFGCSDNGKSTNSSPGTATAGHEIESWITKADQSVLLQKATNNLSFSSPSNTNAFIDIDSAAILQTIDGFGYTLTGGSASLISKMNAAERSALLNELFGKGDNSINIS